LLTFPFQTPPSLGTFFSPACNSPTRAEGAPYDVDLSFLVTHFSRKSPLWSKRKGFPPLYLLISLIPKHLFPPYISFFRCELSLYLREPVISLSLTRDALVTVFLRNRKLMLLQGCWLSIAHSNFPFRSIASFRAFLWQSRVWCIFAELLAYQPPFKCPPRSGSSISPGPKTSDFVSGNFQISLKPPSSKTTSLWHRRACFPRRAGTRIDQSSMFVLPPKPRFGGVGNSVLFREAPG